MKCEHFGTCGSCVLNLPYEKQIEHKIAEISAKFRLFWDGKFDFYPSKETKFRNRAEFGIFHDEDRLNFTMNGVNNRHIKIDKCYIVDEKISNFMDKILPLLQSNKKLNFKLFGIEFISTNDDFLTVLLYHRDIYEIKDELDELHKILHTNLIVRSRGKKLVYGNEILNETLQIKNKKFFYKFEADAFVQPNRHVNEKMIEWVLDCIDSENLCKDLLEMYCGHGNFTIPLSKKFRYVLANEISKNSIKNAISNCELNGVKNINFIRMDSDDLMNAFAGGRKYNRLKELDLKSFDISHILVDPPRAGLSQKVIEFVKLQDNIIYISCNPQTLNENLFEICKTHKVVKFAIFDQFAHTNHTECGVYLKRK